MKRALTLGLLLIATAASSADLALATRHTELRALDVTPSRASSSRKVQWAPSGNFSALHTRAVFRGEIRSESRPYGREEGKTAAGAGIFLSRDEMEGALNSAPSLHRFAYAHANPLRYTDPTGHSSLESCGKSPEAMIACAAKDVQDLQQLKFVPKPPLSAVKAPTEAIVREGVKTGFGVKGAAFVGAVVGVVSGAKAREFEEDKKRGEQALASADVSIRRAAQAECAGGNNQGACDVLTERGWTLPGGDSQGEMDEGSDQPLREHPGDEAAQQRGGMTDDLERTPHSDPAVDGAPESMDLRTRAQIKRGPVSPSNPDYGSETGRRGSLETRQEIDRVRDYFLKRNPTWTHFRGGTSAQTGEKRKEEYLRGPSGTKGGSFVDLTFKGPGGELIRINTVDADPNGVMSDREETNRDRIFQQDPTTPVITIPKGSIPKEGE